MSKLEPTPPGIRGARLLSDSPLRQGVCPECPWRREMTPGYSVAMPSDESMLLAAKGRLGFRQSCHMNLDQRCRGSEAFRANAGLSTEAEPNPKVVSSEDEANDVWRRRGYVGPLPARRPPPRCSSVAPDETIIWTEAPVMP